MDSSQSRSEQESYCLFWGLCFYLCKGKWAGGGGENLLCDKDFDGETNEEQEKKLTEMCKILIPEGLYVTPQWHEPKNNNASCSTWKRSHWYDLYLLMLCVQSFQHGWELLKSLLSFPIIILINLVIVYHFWEMSFFPTYCKIWFTI